MTPTERPLKSLAVTQTPDLRLREALEERDQALTSLARERALVNALRLARERADEPTPPVYPAHVGLEEPPLRYQMIDAAHDRVKSLVAPLHRLVRRLAARP